MHESKESATAEPGARPTAAPAPGQVRYVFDRSRLPDPLEFYTGWGLTITGRGVWRRANCVFCESRDNFNFHTQSGGFHCWSCPARGGDVVAFVMAARGADFMTAAKELGACVEVKRAPGDGHHYPEPTRPAPLAARDALALVAQESNLIAITGASWARGTPQTPADRARVIQAAARIGQIYEIFR